MNHSVNLKVFLHNEGNTDCRRFTLDPSAITSFAFMKEKIASTFSTLRNTSFKITWFDSDNDEITIVCDEDLITAFTEMSAPGNMKVLHVNAVSAVVPNLWEEPVLLSVQGSPWQVRSRCENPKWQVTPEMVPAYGNPKWQMKSEMVPVYGNPKWQMKSEELPFNGNALCDVCDKPITQFRYKCMQCPDYDLCPACEQKGHHSEHIMMRSSQPTLPRCTQKLMTCLSRSIRRSEIHSNKEMFRAGNRGPACASRPWYPKDVKGKHNNDTRECPVGENPVLFDFAKLLNSLQARNDQGNASNMETDQQSQPAMLGNIVRNVVTSIFGQQEPAAGANQPQSTQATDTKANEKPNTGPAKVQTPGTATPELQNPLISFTSNSILQPLPQKVSIPIEVTSGEMFPDAGWHFVPAATMPELTPSAPADRPKSKIVEGLEQLLEMGFKNEEILVSLLKKYDGNVGQVIKDLLENTN